MNTFRVWIAAAAILSSGALLANPVIYEPAGVQQNVPVATVTGGGWTQCYQDTYNDAGTSLDSILSGCVGDNLMLACRPVGSDQHNTMIERTTYPNQQLFLPLESQFAGQNGHFWES